MSETVADTVTGDDLVRETAILLMSTSRSAFTNMHTILRELGLTGPLSELIWRLEPRDDPPAMKDLATAMHCDRSNITGLVEKLVQQDLAQRAEEPRDRRSKVVTLTPKGIKARRALITSITGESVFARLDDQELRDLHRLLSRLA